MYLTLCVEYGRDDQLIFAQQLGVEHVVMAVERWDAASLAHAKNRVEQATLTLAGLEGLSLQGIDLVRSPQRYEQMAAQGELDDYDVVVLDNYQPEQMPSGR